MSQILWNGPNALVAYNIILHTRVIVRVSLYCTRVERRLGFFLIFVFLILRRLIPTAVVRTAEPTIYFGGFRFQASRFR